MILSAATYQAEQSDKKCGFTPNESYSIHWDEQGNEYLINDEGSRYWLFYRPSGKSNLTVMFIKI